MFFFKFHTKKLLQNHVYVDDKVKTVSTYDLNGTTYVLDANTNKLLGFGVGKRDTIITQILLGGNNG